MDDVGYCEEHYICCLTYIHEMNPEFTNLNISSSSIDRFSVFEPFGFHFSGGLEFDVELNRLTIAYCHRCDWLNFEFGCN